MDISDAVTAGVQLWPQHVSWPEVVAGAVHVDRLGYHSLWTWDHFYPHVGKLQGSNFEAWTMMSALAALTTQVRLGVLVSSVTYRHPSLIAYQTGTLDHISGGRSAVGLGAGWFMYEHERLGFDLGSPKERLNRLREAAFIIRGLLHGEKVTCDGMYFHTSEATLETQMVGVAPPIVIGGGGEKVTLGIVANYADVWNFYGSVETMKHKSHVLNTHCERIERNPREITRSVALQVIVRDLKRDVDRRQQLVFEHNRVSRQQFTTEAGAPIAGSPADVAEQVKLYVDAGFGDFILMGPAPYDIETFERFYSEVMPML